MTLKRSLTEGPAYLIAKVLCRSNFQPVSAESVKGLGRVEVEDGEVFPTMHTDVDQGVSKPALEFFRGEIPSVTTAN